MTTLVTLLGRKPAAAPEKPAEQAAPQPAAKSAPAPEAELEVDNDLFSPVATQLGQENEAVRNLLLDAEHKLGELDIIKQSIGKLVDPVSKTLRAYEEAKSEKISLQGVLKTTRIAYVKVRDDLESAQKKSAIFEAECARLRDVVSTAQQNVAILEKTKAEQIAELNTRRNAIVELQRHVQQTTSDLQTAREETRKFGERIATADKRTVQLEGATKTAQQKAMQAEQERNAVQGALDNALAELAQTARKLTETDKSLTMTTARLKLAETGLVEAQAERARLSATLDEANQKHLDEIAQQRSRFDALAARSTLTETLLDEARQALLARADEVATFERRLIETNSGHGMLAEKLGQIEIMLSERDQRIRDLEDSRTSLGEQAEILSKAVASRESAYNLAQLRIREQEELVQMLEGQLKAARDASEMQAQQLHAELQRERLERSMAEGALQSGRKDIARLLREIGALQYRPSPAGPEAPTMPDRLRTAA